MKENVIDSAEFRLAIDSAPEMIVILDPNGAIAYANKFCEQVTGFRRDEIVGKRADTLWWSPMPPAYPEELWGILRSSKKVFEIDVRNKRKDGQSYDAHVVVSPVVGRSGEVVYFIDIERDITREKSVDRLKSDFVSLASHQLRTPLSVMRWSTEALLAAKTGYTRAEQRRIIQGIARTDLSMIDLVDTMLQISRLEAGTSVYKPTSVNLAEAIKQETDILSADIKRKKLAVSCTIPPAAATVYADKSFLEVVVQNLLSNAVKYTPQKGVICLLAKAGKQAITLEVSDTGYGIPKSQQEQIFTKMFRADNVKESSTEGTGLGLYLVKLLVARMNGKIWFTSVLNKGTRFYVTLPKELKT